MDTKGTRVRTLPDGSGAWSPSQAPSAASPSSADARPPSQRLRSVPPLDPTVPPSVARLPVRPSSVSGVRPIARPPVLASECLRDDIAPLDPHDALGKKLLVLFGVGILGVGSLLATSRVGAPSYVIGGGTALAGLLVVSSSALTGYHARGAAAAIAGTASAGFAAAALVTSHAFSAQPALLALRVVAPIALAAVLLLRATYRASGVVRSALGPCIALFVAAALFAGGVPVWSPAASIVPRIAAASMGVVALLSLLGFMGEQTTGGTHGWSVLALVVGAASIVLDGVAPLSVRWIVPSIALACAMGAMALGVFQLVASRIGPKERARGITIPAEGADAA